MGKNGYLQKRAQTIEMWRRAERDTWVQYMADTLMITLNTPEVMGNDTFGQKRILALVEGWRKIIREYDRALDNDPESDYYQEKLDERLKCFLDDENFFPFAERYPCVTIQKYGKKGGLNLWTKRPNSSRGRSFLCCTRFRRFRGFCTSPKRLWAGRFRPDG